MRINSDLNLVVDVERDVGEVLYVHATPVSFEVYRQNFMVMSQTFAHLFSSGLREIAGPSAAVLLLEEVVRRGATGVDEASDRAAKDAAWERVRLGLVAEIARLANVIYLGPAGWVTEPFASAVSRGVLSQDEHREVEGQLLFFTLMARVGSRRVSMAMQRMAGALWGSALTPSTCTAYAASLPTSTAAPSTSTPAAAGAAPPAPGLPPASTPSVPV